MKSSLDLSEFERCGEILHRPLLRQVKTETQPKPAPIVSSAPVRTPKTTPLERKSHEIGQYKFIPVGFEQKHLTLLDDAKFNLKRTGHLKASRSSIIRILIERHAREVIESYRNNSQ